MYNIIYLGGWRKPSSNYIGGWYIKSYIEKGKSVRTRFEGEGGVRLSLIPFVPWTHSRHGERERERERVRERDGQSQTE